MRRDPQRQGPQGIDDSVQKFYDQTMKGGHNVGDPKLVHYLTDNALGSVHWMEKLGVQFKKEVGTATGLSGREATIRQRRPETPTSVCLRSTLPNTRTRLRF